MKTDLIKAISSGFDKSYLAVGSFDDFGEECFPECNEPLLINMASLQRISLALLNQETSDTWDLTLENSQLRSENYMLQEKLRSIENRLSAIESHIPKEKVTILRDISYADAKKEIKEMFLKGKTLYYSDISQELGISLHTVVEICNELHENGEIVADD